MLLLELSKLLTLFKFFPASVLDQYFLIVVLMGIALLVFVPFRCHKIKHFSRGVKQNRYYEKLSILLMLTIHFLRVLLAAVVAKFDVKSKAREGFFDTFLAFFRYISPFLSKFLKKSPKPSAFIVLSLTLLGLFFYKWNNNQLLLCYLQRIYHHNCLLWQIGVYCQHNTNSF